MNAIEVRGMRKCYGSHEVLHGIDLTVQKGELFALLGANGAGKTTALECMEGLLHYDSGSVAVNCRFSVQLQLSSLPPNLRVIEAVQLFSRWNKTRVNDSILQALGLETEEMKRKLYRELSVGQNRRLHLAIALQGDPDLLFLDEPTAGLDVEARAALHELLKELKRRGKTILLTSHDMAQVEELCDRIAILKEGQLAFVGTPDALLQQTGFRSVVTVKTSGGTVRLPTEHIAKELLAFLQQCEQDGTTVDDIYVRHATLENCYLSVVKGEE